MKVAVAYAEAKRQVVIDIDVADGTSAEQAIHRSGVLGRGIDVDLAKNKIGIFGSIVPPDQVLSDGDRVEIYRPAVGKPPKKGGKVGTDSEQALSGEVDPDAAKAAKLAATQARIAAAKAKASVEKTA